MSARLDVAKVINNFRRTRNNWYHSLTDVYPSAISKRKERLIEVIKEKSEIAARSETGRKLKVLKGYYTLEMAPPMPNEMQKLLSDLAIVREFITSGAWKHLTVKQLWLLFLVAWEVSLWFYLGETVGKFHIVGYKV